MNKEIDYKVYDDKRLGIMLKEIKISLMAAKTKSERLGFQPKKGSLTSLVKNIKKEIAKIKTEQTRRKILGIKR